MSNLNTIPWLHYQDIQIPDVAIRQQFDQFMQNGQYVEAINLLNGSQQLIGKAFVADTITKIVNGILTLQTTFDDGVNIFLSDLALQYDAMVDALKKVGEWNSLAWYIPYNFVIYNQEIYMAIDSVPISTPPTDTQYWLKLGLKGKDGVPGTNVTMRYEWQSIREYTPYDVVAYGTNLYVALQANMNVIPGTDNAIWLLFLQTEKGKINVGTTAPVPAVQNTIWFKTDVDPLTATFPLIGQFYRYTSDNTWEEMHPQTIFTWIEGREAYAPMSTMGNIEILTNMWTPMKNEYTYTYTNAVISNTSQVEIYLSQPLNEAQMAFYSTWTIEVEPNKIIFTAKGMPVDIPILIKIQ